MSRRTGRDIGREREEGERKRGREGENHSERDVTHLGHGDVMATRL